MILRKQRAKIDSLTSENKQLVHDVALLQSVPRDVEHRLLQKKSAAAREEGRDLALRLGELLRVSKEFDASIETLRNRLIASRKDRETVSSSEKECSVLERRLNAAIVSFNEVVGSNAVLRTSVDGLRQEKQNFGRIKRRLDSDIGAQKKLLSELIDKINSNYSAKDKAMSDLQHLRAIANREHFEFEREWKELAFLIDQDSKLNQYMDSKSFAVQIDSEKDKNETESSSDERSEVLEMESQECLEDENEEHLQRYESIFERIKESVGIGSITELLDFFSKKELLNYSLFNHCNSVASNIEKKDVSIKDLACRLRPYLEIREDSQERAALKVCEESPGEEELVEKLRELDKFGKKSHSILTGIKKLLEEYLQLGTAKTADENQQNDEDIPSILSKIESMLDPLLLQVAGTTCLNSRGAKPKNLHSRSGLLVNLPSSILMNESSLVGAPTKEKRCPSASSTSTRPSTGANHRVCF